MRLLSYRHLGKPGFGAVKDEAVVDLTHRLRGRYSSVRDVIANDALVEVEDLLHPVSPDLSLADIEFLIPVPDADKIYCIGRNYAGREEEYENERRTEFPNLFPRVHSSFTGHGQPLFRPHVSEQLDYEGEIALVIGKAGRYIPQADALSHIAGLTIANEGTLRDWLRKSKRQIAPGKNFDSSGSIGPWIDTAPVTERPLHIRTWVNNELRQDDDTSRMIWPFSFLVYYISQFSTLLPGDMILTGTPAGAGARFDPPRFLAPGDCLKIEVEGVGALVNPVAAEDAALHRAHQVR